MQRNRQRLAEIQRSAEEERAVAGDERVGDVGPRGAVYDERAGAGHQERKEAAAAPLAGRYPDLVGQQQHGDDAAIGRVEDVLAVDSNQELAGDRHDRCEDGEIGSVGAQQQAQREPGNQSAARAGPERRPPDQPIANPLCREDSGQQKNDPADGDVEIEPPHPIDEQGRKCGYLIQARIGHARAPLALERSPRVFLQADSGG